MKNKLALILVILLGIGIIALQIFLFTCDSVPRWVIWLM